MKKFLTKGLVAVLLLSLLLTTVSSVAMAAGYVKATKGSTWIRQEPDRRAKSLASLPKGKQAAQVSIAGKNSGGTAPDGEGRTGIVWYSVEYKGVRGWVSSKYVTFTEKKPAAAATKKPATTTKEVFNDTRKVDKGTVQITGANVNVRGSASQEKGSGILGRVKKGKVLTFTGLISKDHRGIDWYQVVFNGKNAWVSSKYAKIVKK